MILYGVVWAAPDDGIPRESGDDPAASAYAARLASYSPRERG